MSKPWDFVKSFERKSFERASQETNNSMPIAVYNEPTLSPNVEIIIEVSPPEIVLPPEELVVEIMVPVEKPKRKRRRKK